MQNNFLTQNFSLRSKFFSKKDVTMHKNFSHKNILAKGFHTTQNVFSKVMLTKICQEAKILKGRIFASQTLNEIFYHCRQAMIKNFFH